MMRFEIMEISPEQATAWLERNVKNRKLRTGKVQSIAADIENGDWMLTHQAIGFDSDGELLDGQHRLEAIRMAGRPVVSAVAFDVPTRATGADGKERRTMIAVDRGSPRTVPDQLSIEYGMKHATEFVTLGNLILRAFVGARTSMTAGQALRLAEVWPEVTSIARLHVKALKPALKVTPIKAAVALAIHSHPAEALGFWEGYATGQNLEMGTAAHTLREAALNAALSGEPLIGGKNIERLRLFRETLEGIRCLAAGEPYPERSEGEEMAGLKFFRSAQEEAFRRARDLMGAGFSNTKVAPQETE